MGRKVFVSVLGFTNYGECVYCRSGYKSNPVRFVQEATLEYLMKQCEWTDQDTAYILLTEGAERNNWLDNGHKNRSTGETIQCEGLQTRFAKMNLPFEVQTISNLPHGNNENEIWDIFERVFNQLQNGDELYFDLTHGFRYLPMLVMVLNNYSKFLKHTVVKSITYGNYESRNTDNEAPIIDLLPLSSLQNWTFAAGQFLDSGNVQRLIDLSNAKIRPLMISSKGKNEEALLLKKFTNCLNVVIEDMQTCRGKEILNAVNLMNLHGCIEKLQSTFIKPLNPVFEKVKSRFNSFKDEGNADNLFEAAKWCLDNGLYQQAITILQEGILTYMCQNVQLDFYDKDLRTAVSAAINLYSRDKKNEFSPSFTSTQKEAGKSITDAIEREPSLQNYVRIYVACTEFRNDLNHSGMRANPKPAANIKRGIGKIFDSLSYNEGLSKQELCPNAKSKRLINLSNHPHEIKWCEKQKKEAMKYGDIMDMPFPQVNANDDSNYIEILADEYFQKIQRYACDYEVTVHLMGEMTFCFSLLKRLQESGILCIASTSKRIVKGETKGKKEEVIFEFERFREYR